MLEGNCSTSLYNFPVQATASDGFKQALVLLDRELKDKDARIVHTIHDEIIIEAKDEMFNKVKIILEGV